MKRITRLLIFSDIMLISSAGLIGPIFAIFVEHLNGGGEFAAGMAAMIYLLTSAMGELLFGAKVDKIKNHKKYLVTGSLILACSPLMFMLINNVYQLFVIEFITGIGAAISYPVWYYYFSNSLQPGKRGYAWSRYDFFVKISSAITAGLGGWIAQNFGFRETFLIVSILGVVGVAALTTIRIPSKKHVKHVNARKHKHKRTYRTKI